MFVNKDSAYLAGTAIVTGAITGAAVAFIPARGFCDLTNQFAAALSGAPDAQLQAARATFNCTAGLSFQGALLGASIAAVVVTSVALTAVALHCFKNLMQTKR